MLGSMSQSSQSQQSQSQSHENEKTAAYLFSLLRTVGSGAPKRDAADEIAARTDVYLNLAQRLRTDPTDQLPRFVAATSPQLLNACLRDLSVQDANLTQAVLRIVGFSLHHPVIVESIDAATATTTFETLLTWAARADNKVSLSLFLWCIAVQTLPSELAAPHVVTMIRTIEVCSDMKFRSPTIEIEALSGVENLLTRYPDAVEPFTFRWGQIALPYLLSEVERIYEKAIEVVECGLPMLIQHRADFRDMLAAASSKRIIVALDTSTSNRSRLIFVLRAWGVFVRLLDTHLHQADLLNEYLTLIKPTFSHPIATVRISAMHAWTFLIDNFADAPHILASPRRLSFLLKVFDRPQDPHMAVREAIVRCWWHLIVGLKQEVLNVFDLVVKPFFAYCLHTNAGRPLTLFAKAALYEFLSVPSVLVSAQASSNTAGAWHSAVDTSSNQPMPTAAMEHEEVVALLKNLPARLIAHQHPWSMSLHWLSSQLSHFMEWIRHLTQENVGEVEAALRNDSIDRVPFDMASHWRALADRLSELHHLLIEQEKTLLNDLAKPIHDHQSATAAPQKREKSEGHTESSAFFSPDVGLHGLSILKQQFQGVLQQVLEARDGLLSSLGQLESICDILFTIDFVDGLSDALLSQKQFPFKTIDGQANHIAAYLVRSVLQLRHSLLSEDGDAATLRIINLSVEVNSRLLTCGLSGIGAESCLIETYNHLESSLHNSLPVLLSAWNLLAVTHQQLLERNEFLLDVDGCCDQALLIPIRVLLTLTQNRSHDELLYYGGEQVYQECKSNWQQLLAATIQYKELKVTGSNRIMHVDQICAKLSASVDQQWNATILNFAIVMISKLVDVLPVMGATTVAASRTNASPKKQENTANSHSPSMVLTFLSRIMQVALKETEIDDLILVTLLSIAQQFVIKVNHLQLIQATIRILAPILSTYFARIPLTVNRAVIVDTVTELFSRTHRLCADQYDASLLQNISPLLEWCLSHQDRELQLQATSFWTRTFSRSKNTLTYPQPLLPLLQKHATRSGLNLPEPIESKMQVDDIVVPSPSHSKAHAPNSPTRRTFIGRFAPNVPLSVPSPAAATASKLSAANSTSGEKGGGGSLGPPVVSSSKYSPKSAAKRKIDYGINDDTQTEFEVIPSPVKSRRLYTEHQLEAKKRETALLTYTSLDSSQDISMTGKADEAVATTSAKRSLSNGPHEALDNDNGKHSPDRHPTSHAPSLSPAPKSPAPKSSPSILKGSSEKHPNTSPSPHTRSVRFNLPDNKPASAAPKTSSVTKVPRTANPTPSDEEESFLVIGKHRVMNSDVRNVKRSLADDLIAESYDQVGPIFPALLGNDDPIDEVARRFGSKSVKQLLLAKNIKTIGDLAKLTRQEVSALPISFDLILKVLQEWKEKASTPESKAAKTARLAEMIGGSSSTSSSIDCLSNSSSPALEKPLTEVSNLVLPIIDRADKAQLEVAHNQLTALLSQIKQKLEK